MMRSIRILLPMLCLALISAPCAWSDDELELLQPQVYDLGGEPVPPPKAKKPVPKPKPRQEAEKFVVSPPPPPPPQYEAPPQRPTPPPPPVRAGEDSHFIQPDDYFVQRHGLEGHTWIWVELAKMVNSPAAHTKGEGEFMKVRDGKNYWTSHFWQTRVASQAELRLGLVVIAFNDHHRNDGYDAPDRKDRARGGSWFMAKITDMSDMYKGYVTVSGSYKVTLSNLRILVP